MAAQRIDLEYFINRDISELIYVYSIDNTTFPQSDETPFNYDGCTAKMQVRNRYSNETGKVYFTLSTSDYTISLSTGLIELSLPKESINITAGKYLYDIVLTFPDGTEVQHLYGEFIVKPTVTIK